MQFNTVVTNGCFDILHFGHISLLKECSNLGKKVIVGLNSDLSVKKLKGESRPIQREIIRAKELLQLKYVSHVTIFDDLTPQKLVHKISPDVLVKGGDYKKNEREKAN